MRGLCVLLAVLMTAALLAVPSSVHACTDASLAVVEADDGCYDDGGSQAVVLQPQLYSTGQFVIQQVSSPQLIVVEKQRQRQAVIVQKQRVQRQRVIVQRQRAGRQAVVVQRNRGGRQAVVVRGNSRGRLRGGGSSLSIRVR